MGNCIIDSERIKAAQHNPKNQQQRPLRAKTVPLTERKEPFK